MAKKNCGNKNCGPCSDDAIIVPATFSNDPEVCPEDSETCSELFDADCVCWPGPDMCELDIRTGDRIPSILRKIVLSIRDISCQVSSLLTGLDVTAANIGSQAAFGLFITKVGQVLNFRKILPVNGLDATINVGTEDLEIGIEQTNVIQANLSGNVAAPSFNNLNITSAFLNYKDLHNGHHYINFSLSFDGDFTPPDDHQLNITVSGLPITFGDNPIVLCYLQVTNVNQDLHIIRGQVAGTNISFNRSDFTFIQGNNYELLMTINGVFPTT